MRIYFDLCALKRPFDDRSQPRVDREARAVLEILERHFIRGYDTFVWSSALTVENDADPNDEVRSVVGEYEALAEQNVTTSLEVVERIEELHRAGLAPLDAAHLALAEAASCDVLLTCDDRFQKRARRVDTLIRVLNPVEYSAEVSNE
jgi:predicted nucleic acid-binding protein